MFSNNNVRLLKKVGLTFRIMMAVVIIIGSFWMAFMARTFGNVVGRAQADYKNTIREHETQLNTELEVGSIFTNRENLKIKIINKEHIGGFLMLELSINTTELKNDKISDNVINKLEPVMIFSASVVKNEYKNDTEFMETYLCEGGFKPNKSQLKVSQAYESLPNMKLNNDNNGMIYTYANPETHKIKQYGEVFYGEDSRIRVYVNDTDNAFLTIFPLYNSGVVLTLDSENYVSKTPMPIYMKL